MLLAKYIAWRQRYDDWSQATVQVRKSQLSRLIEYLTDERERSLTTAAHGDLTAWVETYSDLTPDALANLISAAKGLYDYLIVELELREDDPTRRLRRPRIRKRDPRPMPEQYVERALQMAVADEVLFAMLALIFCAGLRCGELARIAKADVEPADEAGSGLLWVQGKGNKTRVVPLSPGLCDVLRPLLRGRPGPLFPSRFGKHQAPNAVSKKLNTFLREEVGCQHTAHSGRHRFGTDYHGFDPSVFRQAGLMGHASVETTQRYTRVNPKDTVEPMRQLAEHRLGDVADIRNRRRRRSA